MVRCSGIGRSKGCAVCRRRKVKCDEKQPSCSQCLRLSGVSCPGATSGHVYLLVNDKNPQKHSRLENPQQQQQQQQQQNPQLRKYPNTTTSSGHKCLTKTINAAGLHETQVVARLISFFAKPNITKTRPTDWMIHLLSMISDGSHIAHKSSILSTSLALYSAIHHDDTVYATEARKWYGVGLRRMKGRLLSLLPGSDNFPLDRPKKRTTICAEDVSMALMLAYYELFLPTSPNAYFEHILAAGRFLQALGPEMCQRGHLNDLFRTIRVHMLYVSLVKGHSPLLQSEAWTTIPFKYKAKKLLDNIVDVITSFSGATVSVSGITDSIAFLLPFMIELHSIKELLIPTTTTTTIDTDNEGGETETGKITLYGLDLWQYHISVPSFLSSSSDQSPPFPDSEEIVVTVAYYSLAWILILNQVNATNEESETTFTAIIQAHCSSILTAAAYMDSCEDGCSYIRMILPLRIVADFMAFNSVQRESALYHLGLWRREKGFKCNLTLAELIPVH